MGLGRREGRVVGFVGGSDMRSLIMINLIDVHVDRGKAGYGPRLRCRGSMTP